jgi:hypothetical protein
MFNFRDLIPWPRATDYQKMSEEIYQARQQEKQAMTNNTNNTNDFSFSVGPSISFDDGAAITFKQTGGLTTTAELGYNHVRTLIKLLETVVDSVEES